MPTVDQLKQFITAHWMLSAAFVLILLLVIIEEIRSRASGVKRVSPSGLTHLINREQAIVVDLRGEAAFSAGHILGAKCMSASTFISECDSLHEYKERPIVLACKAGQDSATMANKLQRKGFSNVYYLVGGMGAWQQANLPLTKKAATKTKQKQKQKQKQKKK